MQVTCSNCRTTCSADPDRPGNDILVCAGCGHYIKTVRCPECGSPYAITFSRVTQRFYRYRCQVCTASFTIEFPEVKETPASSTIQRKKEKSRAPVHAEKDTDLPGTGFSFSAMLSAAASAFTLPRMTAALIGSILMIALMSAHGYLLESTAVTAALARSQFFKSFMILLRPGLFLFAFLLTSTVIANMNPGISQSRNRVAGIAGYAGPVLCTNIVILLMLNSILVLTGRIPVVGPLFFSVLFFPVYCITLVAIILLVIGFWFYPPVLARSGGGLVRSLRQFSRFTAKHNLRLLFTIPVMGIYTSLILLAIHILTGSALRAAVTLSRGILGQEALRTFSAVPGGLVEIADTTLSGSGIIAFRELLGGLLVNHHIGGFLIGLLLAGLSLLLYASFISITGTLSAAVFLFMEQDAPQDDRSMLRLLAVLVLILSALVLFRHLFFQ